MSTNQRCVASVECFRVVVVAVAVVVVAAAAVASASATAVDDGSEDFATNPRG